MRAEASAVNREGSQRFFESEWKNRASSSGVPRPWKVTETSPLARPGPTTGSGS